MVCDHRTVADFAGADSSQLSVQEGAHVRVLERIASAGRPRVLGCQELGLGEERPCPQALVLKRPTCKHTTNFSTYTSWRTTASL